MSSPSTAASTAAVSAGGTTATAKFSDFAADFQSKIAALALRDPVFMERTEGLIKPDYFDNVAEGALVNIGLRYYEKYKQLPDVTTLARLIKQDVDAKIIRKDLIDEVKGALRNTLKADISGRDYAVEEVGKFAQYQAMTDAILASVEDVERGNFDKALERVKKAAEVGADDVLQEVDFWNDIDQRTSVRKDIAAGVIKKEGITTGLRPLDKLLFHEGWGRKEMVVFMGGPKSGKSMGLAFFAKNASLAGYNVLIVTLEVSRDIYASRLDACISAVAMRELESKIIDVQDKVKDAGKKAGRLSIIEFPSGTLSPMMLRRQIAKYKARGVTFDLIVADYADLMAPNHRTDNDIANSKSVYTDLRAIAQEECAALLTATQTNREGSKSNVAGMEHVAEDFNKVRIADLMISINATEDEKARNEARLYLVASRNQEGGLTVLIEQERASMQFVKSIKGVEKGR